MTIPQGQIGYIFARDGVPLAPTQTLAKSVGITDYSDAEAFLAAGGQRGPQRQILRDGTYAVNLAQFVVITKDVVHSLELGEDDALLRTMAKVKVNCGTTRRWPSKPIFRPLKAALATVPPGQAA